jgi:peptide deformylase
MELRIRTWPDKVLRFKCREVKSIDKGIRGLLDDMCVLMRQQKGVGLAANQAGLDLRLVVIEVEGDLFKLVNPRIVKKSGKTAILEGCLSFPGLELKVKRAKKVWVSYLNEKGEPLHLEVDGVLAIIAQHEIDHLNGISFIDRVPFWERLKTLPQLRLIKKGNNGMPK